MDSYDFNLGAFHRPISTSNVNAQAWFTRGLIWNYGFNHGEAASCFKKAITHDPDCAMAHWGLAYCLGPNYNKPWAAFDPKERAENVARAHHAAVQARACYATVTSVEKALIVALQSRYPEDSMGEDLEQWNQKYAEAMESVYGDFSEDLDVAALYADSLMNLTPGKMWDLHTVTPAPTARTFEVKTVLDKAIARQYGLSHPGLLHLFIHCMDMSGTPEKALIVADHLRGLVPDAGHLNHMPSHIDILVGDYRAAITSNTEAMRADRKFIAKAEPLTFYTVYTAHNFHFRIFAAMFSGQSGLALETARMLEEAISEELLRVESPPMADWLEGFVGMRVHVLVRFGRWSEIVDLPLPADTQLYCATTAILHYAKGIAYAVMGKVDQAEEERKWFTDAVKTVPPTRRVFEVSCQEILAVASAMLDGELAYRRGDFDNAFADLRRSVNLYDKLPYMEPWGWMQPTRHALGALLLEQGHIDEAADVYAQDLGLDDKVPRALQHPGNVWALRGLYECLERKGGRGKELKILRPLLRVAEAVADVEIRSSCFCRING